ncbi:formate dehydrogenase accessory sulfurtransferase FdhD [Microbulbifer magnicolonia]|uniref:formate dehydrogenase accessory sulfurtransferase FdhD n=1 Tax=Microbulbifer magnicolonia TaxID=3109744 RepID=UPI002B400600|nr:formate dehydrogenase accessory sulfurtransferase FdhD [Microbulbifer sp. GG15]
MSATSSKTTKAVPAVRGSVDKLMREGIQYAIRAERAAGEAAVAGFQQLAEETAVAISYNGVNHAVMMATPEDLEDYAIGFSVANGIVQDLHQILDIQLQRACDTVRLEVRLNQRAHHELRLARRALAGSSGCGLCGVQALSQALAPLPRFQPESGNAPPPPSAHLRGLRERFRKAQKHGRRSGAMHAAIYVDSDGETLLCREDIGRHNAMDKLLGACLRRGLAPRSGFVAITSRCSLELIQKAARAGVGTLVSLSSPTDMSVRWAREYHLNLLHQPAQGPARLYSPLAQSGKEPG